MRRWALISLAGAAWTVACGLDTSGLGPPDVDAGASSSGGSGGSGGVGGDAAGSGSSGGSASGSGGGSGSGSGGTLEGGAMPDCVSGWTLVIGEVGGGAPCPAGYADAYQGVTNPQAQPGACTCSCTITQQPNCTVGNVAWNYGTQAPMCPMASPMYSSGNCTPFFSSVMLATAQQVQPIPMTGGTCAGQAVGNTTMVQQSSVQTCSVPDASVASVCGGHVPSGFAACVIAPGDVPCPTGSPFSNRSVVADSEMLVCSACSSCHVSGTCANPALDIYSDGQCKNLLTTIPANGKCASQQGGSAGAYWYQAQVQAQCAAAGASASFQAKNPQTLCCR